MSIQLRQNNPYAIGKTFIFKNGTQALDRPRLAYKETAGDKIHTVTDFDTLSDLANEEYGDSKFWWVIADINDIFNPFLLTPGDDIIIPDLNSLKALVL